MSYSAKLGNITLCFGIIQFCQFLAFFGLYMALKVKSDLKFEISGLNYQCSYDHWAPKRLSWGKWHEEKEEKKEEEEEVLQSIYLLSSMQVIRDAAS